MMATSQNQVDGAPRHARQEDALAEVRTETDFFARLGWWIVLAGVGGFLLWAGLAPLDKGVPLNGTVTVESNRKPVQHESGGTVDAILVKEGQAVKAGDVLIRMNSVQASADAETMRGQYFIARLTQARLLAEQDGMKAVAFPEALKGMEEQPSIASNFQLQRQLFLSRQSALHSELASIDENLGGLVIQNKALEELGTNKQQQLAFMKEQLDSLRDLAREGFVPRNRLLDLEQSYAQINGAIAENVGAIGRGRRQIAELRMKRQQTVQEHQKEIRTQLSDVQKEAESLASRLSALDYHLTNVLVKAPVDGTVIGLSIFSRNAVIAPGFRMMDIIPSADPLIVEGRLPVHLIDKMHANLDVELIFSAFNQNKTPHIPGTVTQVSADRLQDEKTGEPYYKVLAKATPEGMQKIAHLKVRAGMPVDLFVKTGERTMLSYLLNPLVNRFNLSMSEE